MAEWCKETDKRINYTKLCRLLVDGGTQALRAEFDRIHSPSSLTAALSANKTKLQKLKKPKGKVLNNEQWDKLYPPSGSNPKSEDFDVTLLFVLLRNICGLPPPATGWDVLPPITDTSLEANLARIKYYRNNTIAHKPNTEINDADYEQYWQDISSALVSLGLSQEDIDDLKSAPLGEKKYNQLLYDWYISDKDIKTQLEDLKSTQRSNTAAIMSETKDIKEELHDLHTKLVQFHSKGHYVDQLATDEFSGLIESLCRSFHPDTRQWVLEQVKSHIDSDQPESHVMLITAGPGMGKSTIAAKICQTYKDLGCLGGCHFFQFSNSTRNNPRLMLQSIARQMCDTIPGYGEALERKLQTNFGSNISDLKCEELFTVLFEEPLHKLKVTEKYRCVIVLDAIDECHSILHSELQDVLAMCSLSLLPSWLRFIITSRPTGPLSKKNLNIDPKDPRNTLDLENFFESKLKGLYGADHNLSSSVGELAETSKGLFLVAFFVVDYLKKENIASLSKVHDLFPNGISSVYEKYFSRLKEVLSPYISDERKFFEMLEAVVASKHPIERGFFYRILGLKSERDVREIPGVGIKSRKIALDLLHSLFPVENDHVSAFHKSVVDWLILEGENEHDFSVLVEDGTKVLDNLEHDLRGNCNEDLNAESFRDIRDTYKKNKILRKDKDPKVPHDLSVRVEDGTEVLDNLEHDLRSNCNEDLNAESFLDIRDTYKKNKILRKKDKDAKVPHDFSVRVEDGEKVLANQCYEVLSDIRNGEKDLEKPLDLTDTEKYALEFGFKSMMESSILSDDTKIELLTNCFVLSAFESCQKSVFGGIGIGLTQYKISHGVYGKFFDHHLFMVPSSFDLSDHKKSCPFKNQLKLYQCVGFYLQAAITLGVCEDKLTPKPMEFFNKFGLPFLSENYIADIPRYSRHSPRFSVIGIAPYPQDLDKVSTVVFPCKDGMMVAQYCSPRETLIEKYKKDGTCSVEKCFPGLKRICMSPDQRFIVATELDTKGKVEIRDATTLNLVSSYQSPNVVRSCHVFGDQPWYVVARCYNNKIYVLEGETGRLQTTIDVDQEEDVEAVSATGQIVLSKTWAGLTVRNNTLFTDDDGNFVEEMIFNRNHPTRAEPETPVIYRKLFLLSCVKPHERVSIYPRREVICHCRDVNQRWRTVYEDQAIGFSQDGNLLGYHYRESIFVVKSQDGSLFKRVYIGDTFHSPGVNGIFYLSETDIIVVQGDYIVTRDVATSHIKHVLRLPDGTVEKGLFVTPRQQEEPLTIVVKMQTLKGTDRIIQYVFHNLPSQS